MSPTLTEQALPPQRMTDASAYSEYAVERSPAVSVAIALALLGCLLVGSAKWSLPHFEISALVLAITTEIEVRRLRLGARPGLMMAGAILLGLAVSGGLDALLVACAGALFFPFLLAPFRATGYVGRGTLATSAALGALWGPRLVPAVFIVALVLGGAFILFRSRRGSDLRNLPMTIVIGFAAALVQLIR